MEIFNDSMNQGQQETREQLIRMRQGKGMSDDYSFKIAGKILGFCFIVTIFAFFYLWLHMHVNFFLSILFSILVWIISTLIISLLFTSIFKLTSKSKRYEK